MRKIVSPIQSIFCTEKIKRHSLVVILLILAGCVGENKSNIDDHIGLYEIVKSECNIEKGAFNPCESTRFFEILKGQFIGIEDSDLAYVFWSGDPAIDSELQYTSHLIQDYETKTVSNRKYWISNGEGIKEFLILDGGYLKEYYVWYNSEGKSREIRYTLAPVRRGNLPSFRMNYPGN